MLAYKVNNKIEPASLSDVKVLGFLGNHIDTFFEGRIMSEHARDEVYFETEEAFRLQRDDESGVGIWQGEYWGKWIISAVRAARYNHSEELREFIRKGAKKLVSYQREDGYLGTYKNSKLVFPCTIEEGIRCLGYSVEWNWNLWCRKYTLWGMLEAYGLLGDKFMLDSSVGMADCIIREMDELGVLPNDTGTFNGLPSCSLMKPMLILYRYTEDKKYLDFCLKIADRWENPEIMPGLIANSLSDMRIREWYPDSNKWAKAYEMMSCFDGLIELYRVTGVKKYFEATVRFFDMLLVHERNLLTSVAFNDVFGDAGYDLNCMSEPCDVIHFLRLAFELFRLTGDKKYMDVFEETSYNALFPSACKDGLWGARALRTAGRHQYALYQAKMNHNHCCVNNMPRGFLNFAETQIMTDGRALYINLYTDFEGSIKVGNDTVNVKISGEYFSSGRVNVALTGDYKKLLIKLRLPEWTSHHCVTADTVDIKNIGGYITLTAKSAPFDIGLEFDSGIEITEISSHPELGDLPWKERRYISGVGADADSTAAYISADPAHFMRGKRCIIRKGPLLLCRSKLNGNTEEEMFGEQKLTKNHRLISCERVEAPDGIEFAFDLVFAKGDETLKYRVCDYASGTNVMTLDMQLFSMFF